MHYRDLGRTVWRVSDISFGAWAIGGSWGPVDDRQSMAALHKAIDCGVNLIDTADVYGMGHSERLIARLRKERREQILVATKAGRRLNPHTSAGYNAANLTPLWRTACGICKPIALTCCRCTVRRLMCTTDQRHSRHSRN
jgi:aryl-alcohol dehydrogenase-like predicted oxidoreductase